MKKKVVAVITTIALLLSISTFADAHSGRLDSKGGHNCSEKSKAKGLCTGYHYHNGQSSSSPSKPKNTTSKASKQSSTKAKPTVPKHPPITVIINDEVQSFSQTPVMIDGTTLVPLRGVFEKLGAGVQWDSTSNKITAKKGNKKAVLSVGNKVAYTHHSEVNLPVPAQLINGHTMVPLRVVSEALGATVQWDSTSYTVIITSN